MPKATLTNTTSTGKVTARPRRASSRGQLCRNIRKVAAADFDGMDGLDPMEPRAEFLQDAGQARNVLAVWIALLAKSAEALTVSFRQLDEDGIMECLNGIAWAKDWFSRHTKLMEVIEARALIAASRVATEEVDA